MYSTREHRIEKPRKSKKDKKLSKLINNSDSDTGNESEHELSYYMEDRVKLMKEVLKIIKPKKIKSMAPDCMKKMQIEEINSILLEELLGISKKRLKYIFEGKSLDEESSTDEDQPIDVISLDDISDDDFVIISDEESDKNSKKKKRRKIKEEPKDKYKKIKKEKTDKGKGKEKEKSKDKDKEKEKEKITSKEPMGEENLMSVLELLELQARARAIRSQLDLETKRKNEEQERLEKENSQKAQENGQDDDEEIIIEVPKEVEIVITSSDSENEEQRQKDNDASTRKVNIITTTNENFSQGSNANTLQIEENIETNNGKSVKNKACIEKREGVTYKMGEEDSNSDKEEGEVSDGESRKKEKSDKRVDLSAIPVPDDSKKKLNENTERNTSRENSNSDSDSNDNLQVVMLREKRKKRAFEKSIRISIAKNNGTESVESENRLPKNLEYEKETPKNNIVDNNENPHENELANKKMLDVQLEKDIEQNNDYTSKSDESVSQNIVRGETNVSILQSEDDSQQSKSKIENAIEEFMKTQPPPPDKTGEIKKLEEESKKNEEKAKHTKEKRLKNLKNKLQSYRKDVEGESSVTILENIVIKPVDSDKNRKRVTDDSDDLVINVDQDDLDCIICD